MMQSAPEPPTTTPGVDVPLREPDVATAAPPMLSPPPTVVVASQGPVPTAAGLPATGGVVDVPLVSASLFVVVGVVAMMAARRRRVRHV